MTLLLGRSDPLALPEESCMAALARGFAAKADLGVPRRLRGDLPGAGTATALIPVLADGIPACTVKVNAKFPDARPRCAAWSACTI